MPQNLAGASHKCWSPELVSVGPSVGHPHPSLGSCERVASSQVAAGDGHVRRLKRKTELDYRPDSVTPVPSKTMEKIFLEPVAR